LLKQQTKLSLEILRKTHKQAQFIDYASSPISILPIGNRQRPNERLYSLLRLATPLPTQHH